MRGTKKQQVMQPKGLQLRPIPIYATSRILFVFIYQNTCSSFFLKISL